MLESASLAERFSSCSFTPVTKDVAPFSPVTASAEGAWSTISYYLDSSGRSSFLLPLQLGCRSKEDVDYIVASGCLQPAPQNIDLDEDEQRTPPTSSLLLEVQSRERDGLKAVLIEGITIHSCIVEGNSVLLYTEVVVRPGAYHQKLLKTTLEVTAILAHRKPTTQQRQVASGLLALELGGGSLPLSGTTKHPSSLHANHTRLGPVLIVVSLTHALKISVKSVPGASHGNTLVSLKMMHSNTHSEPVTITNIALHPSHSRQDAPFLKHRSMPGGERSVTDMGRHVQWGYVTETEPQLPHTLHPHDAYSTVITVNATDDLRSRTFASPVSVMAEVGTINVDSNLCSRVVVATDALWSTGHVLVKPSDAFRVDISLQESSCCVRTPFVVLLRVMNLGEKTRDLMLLMAKESKDLDETSTIDVPSVAEVNGYTFGVWGLIGDEDGTIWHKRDNELLAFDSALLLGEVKSQHSVDAQIRFVPLKEGTLRIPDFKLYDRKEGQWYTCPHKLCVVTTAASRSVL